ARGQGLGGRVWNHSRGVTIEVFGPEDSLDTFLERLGSDAPPAASIRTMNWQSLPTEPSADFEIIPSTASDERVVSIPSDLATCPDCRREIFDPSDRRYRYPFTNCTNCGPRFTIARDVPYDRATTTMKPFTMCPSCQEEYEDPDDRRFHAQPNACPDCGPALRIMTPDGSLVQAPDPIGMAARAIRFDLIVAVKGLGGFHLACDATSSRAVTRLRERKRRDEKPFAVMVPDLETADRLAFVSPRERELLASAASPIVLLRRKPEEILATEVAPHNRLVGLMLPYTPLHHLLMQEVGGPIVMTSGNLSEEPIASGDDEAVERLGEIADLFVIHDREIESTCDDSVTRVISDQQVVFRRSRGYVPAGIGLDVQLSEPVLALGAHLKNTFCIAAENTAWLGPHIGDLENLETYRYYEEAIERLQRFLQIEPRVVAHDLHPEYLSTKKALEIEGVRRVAVQHHHAHVASAMAEHHLEGPVIGVAYDGTGYGLDGTAWGGEILLADFEGFERIATFRSIPLAGSHAAIRQVWRIALALLDDAFDGSPPLHAIPLFREIPRRGIDVVRRMIDGGLNTPLAHGVGRYFDGIGSMVLGRPDSRYEGQIALEWNMAADPTETRRYPVVVREGTIPWEIDLRPLVRAVVEDLIDGVSPATISGRFHNTIAETTAQVVRSLLHTTGSIPIVLTGGCFQNALLAERTVSTLDGSDVRLHRNVPPGDGGISLGQVLVADAVAGLGRDRAVEYEIFSRSSEIELASERDRSTNSKGGL
ncbi:MAG: carbamoyltransferase HypF, partial [Thermoanaerobaculia bacterium]|nr:carbamoyltransferase HypF [Thermoanaerobaculia bacterium]